jgi:HK97 gp10 family phage protein
MMAAKVQVLGAVELSRAFQGLKQDVVQGGAARRVAMAGASVLRKEARRIATEAGLRKTGALINNIAVKREKDAETGTEQYNLGVRHGRSLGRGKSVKWILVNKGSRIVSRRANDPFYWIFVHSGTKNIEGVPFISQALENKREASINAMKLQAIKEIARANK